MKVFIAGARSITVIDQYATEKLCSICDKRFSILIGDCYGIDTLVQAYLAQRNYSDVTVYASNGIVRNNVGKWPTMNVAVESNARGFDFFRQKDVAMAKDADLGFMIWDGNSKGTLYNIITLAQQEKMTVVYLPNEGRVKVIRSMDDLSNFSSEFSEAAKREYSRFSQKEALRRRSSLKQIAMFQ